MSEANGSTRSGLALKLAEIMGEVGYVEKRGRNEFHKYDYVTEADLVDAVRTKLAERKVVMIPSLVSLDQRPVKEGTAKASTVTTARVRFTFIDGETGEQFQAEWAGAGEDASDKGIYKAYTGALKYFLMKSFLIPTGDDPELDRPEAKAQTTKGKAKPKATSESPQGSGGALITSGQQRLLFAKSKEAGVPDEQTLKTLVKAAAGVEHSDRIPKARFDDLLAAVADWEATLDVITSGVKV